MIERTKRKRGDFGDVCARCENRQRKKRVFDYYGDGEIIGFPDHARMTEIGCFPSSGCQKNSLKCEGAFASFSLNFVESFVSRRREKSQIFSHKVQNVFSATLEEFTLEIMYSNTQNVFYGRRNNINISIVFRQSVFETLKFSANLFVSRY